MPFTDKEILSMPDERSLYDEQHRQKMLILAKVQQNQRRAELRQQSVARYNLFVAMANRDAIDAEIVEKRK